MSSSPSGREIFDDSLSGAIQRPSIPVLRSDTPLRILVPHSLAEFRVAEGRDNRKKRLQALYASICKVGLPKAQKPNRSLDGQVFTLEYAQQLKAAYENDLFSHFGNHSHPDHIGWTEFESYAEEKETELWSVFHDELDLDGNGKLDERELDLALRKTGIILSPTTLIEFMTFLTSSYHSHAIEFAEFRDFLLLLPRKISTAEIYQYYEMKRYLGDDGKGVARVTMEGDVSLSAEDRPPEPIRNSHFDLPSIQEANAQHLDDDLYEEEEEEPSWMEGHTALKFLLAGGIAGAVSRTATAPLDRLKIFLITRPPEPAVGSKPALAITGGAKVLGGAIARIYTEGGVLAFWTGNALFALPFFDLYIIVAKIFPESAIKFFAYESSKRVFAQYWDKVDDPRDISGVSRFLSGGIGGISSQLSQFISYFYLACADYSKTQMMSSAGGQKRTLLEAARHLWSLGGGGFGGFRAYYRGLTIGLIGVFPYSAIDMSTFEALKLAYLRSSFSPGDANAEPSILALLAFGTITINAGATSVYPLNLVRTRLQASDMMGFLDVCRKTYQHEGWRGFYRGLVPTLAKVVPAVSVSYVVYEHSKRRYESRLVPFSLTKLFPDWGCD
ncbi:mitochondrial carrier [Mycena floridula]|nr:mitochondrial carrier [Mycena floridula]